MYKRQLLGGDLAFQKADEAFKEYQRTQPETPQFTPPKDSDETKEQEEKNSKNLEEIEEIDPDMPALIRTTDLDMPRDTWESGWRQTEQGHTQTSGNQVVDKIKDIATNGAKDQISNHPATAKIGTGIRIYDYVNTARKFYNSNNEEKKEMISEGLLGLGTAVADGIVGFGKMGSAAFSTLLSSETTGKDAYNEEGHKQKMREYSKKETQDLGPNPDSVDVHDIEPAKKKENCLLYTSDAADES